MRLAGPLACLAGLGQLSSTYGFVAPQPQCASKTVLRAESSGGLDRREVLTTGALGAVVGAVVLGAGVVPARADSTLASRKVQYRRYVPRIIAGREYLAGEFKKAIDSKDWKVVSAAYEMLRQAQEGSLRVNPRAAESRFEKELFDPMKLFARTYAEKGTNNKLVALNECISRLELALARIGKVATGDLSPVRDDDEGFLFGLIGGRKDDSADPYAGKNQQQIAQAAWLDAKNAFNDYVVLVNKDLSMSLNKLDPIP